MDSEQKIRDCLLDIQERLNWIEEELGYALDDAESIGEENGFNAGYKKSQEDEYYEGVLSINDS